MNEEDKGKTTAEGTTATAPVVPLVMSWVSVADSLPPYNREVIFAVDYDDGDEDLAVWWGKRAKNGWWGNCADSEGWQRISGVVTHWTTLPAPPQK